MVNVIERQLKFRSTLKRRNRTRVIVIHHLGFDNQSIEMVHNYYKLRTDSKYVGIGFHYYVRRDGSVYRGRPEQAIGAHCYGSNFESIGICFEGDFTSETTMPRAQLTAGIDLLTDVMTRNGILGILMHRDLSLVNCPGAFFPFSALKKRSLEEAKRRKYNRNSQSISR